MSKQEEHLAKLAAMPQPQHRQPPIDCLAWKKPSTTEANLEKLVSKRLLPEKSLGKWRAPPKDHQWPGENAGEIVLFKPFVERGIALPTSKFFRYLLHY